MNLGVRTGDVRTQGLRGPLEGPAQWPAGGINAPPAHRPFKPAKG